MFHFIRQTPWTAAITLVTLSIFCIPGCSELLQLDFEQLSDGRFWLLLSGHLTHFNFSHLFWDLLMFAVLGAVCERRHTKAYPCLLGMIAIVVSAGVWLFTDALTYRGLSGVDSGMFVWLVLNHIRESRCVADRMGVCLWSAPLVGLIGKLCYEFMTGDTLFVESSGFTPLVESHLAGVAGGFMAWIAACCFVSGRSSKAKTERRDFGDIGGTFRAT